MKKAKWFLIMATGLAALGTIFLLNSCTTSVPSPLGGGSIPLTITLSKSTLGLQVGQSQQITATAKDKNNNSINNFKPNWTVTGGIGCVTDGLFTANAVGTGRVIATRGYVYSGCISGEVIITVNPTMGAASALSSIIVSPANASIKVGAGQPFTAAGFDQNGNPIAISPLWSVNGQIGDITQTGNFTATNAGQGAVVAASGFISGQAVVTVEADDQNNTNYTPVLTSILVRPDSAEAFVNEGVGFVAYGFDQNGYAMDFTPLWSTSGGVGTVSAMGAFTATTAGAGKVRASGAGTYGEGSVTVSN